MNLLKRVLIAVLFIPLMLFIFYKGSFYLFGMFGIIIFFGLIEFREMALKKNVKLDFFLPLFGFIFYSAIVKFGIFGFTALFPIIFYLMIKNLFTNRLDGAVQEISTSVFGIIYIAGSLSLGYLVSLSENSNRVLPLLISLVWLTDSFAYFAGMTLGRKRNIFKTSPKKSIIGFVAGIIVPFVFVGLIYIFKTDFLELKYMLALAFATGIFGQLGDLFESIIKRDFGVKDSSNMIPGHGGILDRFDSLFVSITAYWFMIIIIEYTLNRVNL
ncbi:MAG: phosphatidate cytidylyltransferase [Candidatus Cloacimonadota bacterium]|nr:phosphatidate cytidylyltransferase [Candidatus Cloacimonadota bacterium]